MPALQSHPNFPCEALDSITVDVSRGESLGLRYQLQGDLTQLKRSATAEPERTDGLWKSTCFEAFLRKQGDNGYFEFNFAPSGQWAGYRFNGYRDGMQDLVITPLAISVFSRESLDLQVQIELKDILPRNSVWLLGLSAVIEETSGRKSYWALRHPPGKPDFHHPDCFALELPPP